MVILRKFNMGSFLLALVLIMFSGHTLLYGEEQLPDNLVDTTLTYINQVRAEKGLNKLSINPRLNTVAEKHSKQMIEHNMLSDGNSILGTPFERAQSSRITDSNNLVAVAQAKNCDLLQMQLESPEIISKIMSPEMTHTGIGIEQDSTGDLWLTIHMVERAITFTQFILNQSNTDPVTRSIIIKGNTTCKKIEFILVPPENSNPDLAVDRIIVPDSNGDFEIRYSFGTETGLFEFEFYIQKIEDSKLTNFFSISI